MPRNENILLLPTRSHRIKCGRTQIFIADKKRHRRRRREECGNVEDQQPASATTTTTTTISTYTTTESMEHPAFLNSTHDECEETSLEISNSNSNLNSKTKYLENRYKVNGSFRALRMQPHLLLLLWLVVLPLLFLTSAMALANDAPCDSNSWWDPVKNKCIVCTICEGEMLPLRPCQLHRDTICGSIYDLKIDWVVLAKGEPNWKERRKSNANGYDLSALEHQLTQEELQQLHDDSIPMDWQTAALFMAVLACLLFFIVAACILIHHMRQWRRMERRLDQDVEELSTKLMAKLAEVQNLEGGTFFIGNAEALQVPTRFQPQHVLLPADKSSKHLHHTHHQIQHDHRFLKPTPQPGNVYIENGSKG